MERLTTNKNISDMGMYELAHNCCYCKDGNARYRDFEMDMDARDLTRKLMVQYGHWKSCEEYGLDADNELLDNDIFDDTMVESLMYEPNENIGLLALFYRNLWAMADLRERLKYYEDAEEQGLLVKLPCKVGDTLFYINGKFILEYEVTGFCFDRTGAWLIYVEHYVKEKDKTYTYNLDVEKIGKTVFLTKEEAEQALKKKESED